MSKPMSKTDNMEKLISGIDSKLNGLIEQVSSIDRKLELLSQEVSTVKSDVAKLDNRLWDFGGLLLAACLGTLFKILNF
jgi:peptidoglycan hydrolase CwlO-like protein